ncbi:hypothetical protein MG5_06252 [Candida albicans P57072]|nr:hypothetical protein MEO_06233 [Candida albicans P94015]KGQ99770.1 hypothetical protein MG5_06252 [Candida albicans P57072]KHC27443.1 hypothetical protein MGO_06222 [Candida albicans P76055]KHC27630.1 hypothetical protein MGQ_06239 [Candida albicans P76067]
MATTPEVTYSNDRRNHPRNRFAWVKRLMQGQNRTTSMNNHTNRRTSSNNTSNNNEDATHNNNNNNYTNGNRSRHSHRQSRNKLVSNKNQDKIPKTEVVIESHNNNPIQSQSVQENNNIDNDEQDEGEERNSLDVMSDQISDNVSTTPLKSIVSSQSTKSPSILSGDAHNDQTSLIASTAETSLAPSVQTPTNYTFLPIITASLTNTTSSSSTTTTTTTTTTNNNNNATTNNNNNNNTILPVTYNASIGGQDRDSESIVTLASSTRRIRRRSIDTNCSTTGIPPASIMERLSVHPGNGGTNASTYANSIKTSNDDQSFFEESRGP